MRRCGGLEIDCLWIERKQSGGLDTWMKTGGWSDGGVKKEKVLNRSGLAIFSSRNPYVKWEGRARVQQS